MSHWYNEKGDPAYTIIGKNGKERPTTLADAKKIGLVPSVTTILALLDKPGLNIWKINQILEAVLNYGKLPLKESRDTWKSSIIRESERIGKETSARGNEVHNKLEHYYNTGEVYTDDKDFLVPVIVEINKEFGSNVTWYPEKSFYCELGYGGKVDLIGKTSDNKTIIIDFKTKNKENVSRTMATKDHCMQLAAYEKGLDYSDNMCYNLYISTVKAGNVYLNKWENKDIKNGFKMFHSLLKFWKLSNNIV